MTPAQPAKGRRLTRQELTAELARVRQRITELEADSASPSPLLDSFTRHLQDGFSLLSTEGVHLDVNPALCAMVGLSYEELVGVGMPHPYWPPEEQESISRDLSQDLEGAASRVEATFMRKDGARFPVLITSQLIRDEAGELVCVFAIIKDISERRHAEDALRASESHYRAIVENAPIGTAQATTAGRVVYGNVAMATIFGYDSPQELMAEVNRSSLGEVLYEDPADRAEFVRRIRAAADVWVTFESRMRRRDGSVITAQLHFCERAAPDSAERYLYGFVQDVTERQRAAKADERSARILSQGERLAHLGSWEWNVATDTCTVSEEWQRIHGLVGDSLSSDEIILTAHEDDREAVRKALAEAAAGEFYRIDHRVVRPDTGEVRYLTTYGVPTLDAEGRLESVLGASLDVTERVQADEVLLEREERLQRALSETVAALGATVAMRDPYTAGHERRVTELACLIAERLGWSKAALETMRTAALVHDIGKIAIPAEILAKPARLTEVEFDLVKAHPRAACDILMPIDFGAPVAEIVLQHHERLDGSGYPRGLSEAQILPEARVLAIADVVEAMISHRPYRAALPLKEAMAELADGAGTRYDAAACALCRTLFEDEGLALAE